MKTCSIKKTTSGDLKKVPDSSSKNPDAVSTVSIREPVFVFKTIR